VPPNNGLDAAKFVNKSSTVFPCATHSRVLARGPAADRHEGQLNGTVMMIEFDSKEAAEAFYCSAEYQAAKALREACLDTDLMIIEGTE